jgi:hypothetical protein
MVVSATISTSPTLVYFGQEVGEPGAENAGFGKPTRTSIFDYIGVPSHQRWMNGGAFDGGKLTNQEKSLRDFYKRLLNFTITAPALMGQYQDLQLYNREKSLLYPDKIFAYVRWSEGQKLIVVADFDPVDFHSFELLIPREIIKAWILKDGVYNLEEHLYHQARPVLEVEKGIGKVNLKSNPLETFLFEVKNTNATLTEKEKIQKK